MVEMMNVFVTSEQKNELFGAAIQESGAETVVRLIEAGADPNCEEEQFGTGRTPLYAACLSNRVKVIEALLNQGADPNKRFIYRSPVDGRVEADAVAIHYASSAEAVKLLVNAGADVNAAGKTGITALMRAAFNGKVDAVRALLEAGASPFTRQNKRRGRAAMTARELAESKIEFWKEHIDDSNRGKIEENIKRYETCRELLLAAEAKN
jgi:ankyrin repeat protein